MIPTISSERAAPPQAFDVCGRLPRQTTVLEASAGTGKTFTIAALVARYLAEGHATLGELLIVTFGRMATDELRVRVRDRLVGLERTLSRSVRGDGVPADADEVDTSLVAGDPAEVAERHLRVRRALSDFDAATIATTHEFCARMLDGLGVLGNREPDALFTEWLGDLTAEVARDVYLRRYAAAGDPPFEFAEASRIADQVANSPHAGLVPFPTTDQVQPNGPEPAWLRRVAYASTIRAEVERRKLRARIFGYDDMLTRLRDALADPRTGPLAAARLRQRYRIVLVDEFQDTDVVQWEILQRAFAGHAILIMIGDPKQAIYAFRGADVYSYLDAVRRADQVATLARNWRSDQTLTDSLDALLGGASLGHSDIVVRPIQSSHLERRIVLPTGSGQSADQRAGAPLRLRVVEPLAEGRRAPVAQLRTQIQADLVADVTELLALRPRLLLPAARHRSPQESRGDAGQELRPSDIAVLVRKNERGEAIRDALVDAGVPAVMLGSSSVFSAAVATEWLTLLTALEQPRQALARSAALTCFLGWGLAELANADDDALNRLAQQIREWSRVLAARGVAALLELATAQTGLSERLLRQPSGERTLTDLRHIGQELHAAMTTGRLGVSALVEWLREQIARAKLEIRTESTRRLETDAEAVQILTLHRSKGLEFPVVYLPEAWDSYSPGADGGDVLRLHEDGACVLDVGGSTGPGRSERLAAARLEDAGEELRLLYVGLTRAQCSVITWWAASAQNTTGSALHRMLSRTTREGEPARSYDIPADPIGAFSRPGLAVERVEDRAPGPWRPPRTTGVDLDIRRFDRTLDLDWRRTSYSALTAAAHGRIGPAVHVGSEVEVRWEDDEAQVSSTAPSSDVSLVSLESLESLGSLDGTSVAGLDRRSPMQELPGGVVFGTLVHEVLETVDPGSADLAADLRRICGTVLAGGQPGELSADSLADALVLTMQTPLGPLAGGRRLCDIPATDRLAELGFELPLAGGEHTSANIRLGDLAPLLRRHLAPDGPLASYADLLDHPALADQSLRGYLTGSIDAVLRVREPDAPPRYLVVDYKTNWLGTVDGPELRLSDYTPDRMGQAMKAAHYPLQALLYLVALHRMLRWREPDYRPEVHLGGALYLFVRGMAGSDTPMIDGSPCGVFGWQPPVDLVVECSDLLDRGLQ